jgi:hypothetical protein
VSRELGVSKGAALFRKTGAELVQRFPGIVEPLRDGRLCLSSVAALAKVITPENKADVLPRFFHRSKREAAEVVAELKPVEAPPRRAVVTAVRAAPAAELSLVASSAPEQASAGFPENLTRANVPSDACGSSSQPEAKPPVVEPLTADLRRYHLTVSKRFLAKLEAARDALSHAKPGATDEEGRAPRSRRQRTPDRGRLDAPPVLRQRDDTPGGARRRSGDASSIRPSPSRLAVRASRPTHAQAKP